MWNAPNRDQSFTYLLGGRGIRAGSHGKGGGGNRTSPTKYKGRTREFQIKPLGNLSTLNDYVASRVQINLHRTQIKT